MVTPVIGALVLLLLPNNRPEYFKQIAFLFSAAVGAMSVWVLTDFSTEAAGFQLTDHHTWIESLGISWSPGSRRDLIVARGVDRADLPVDHRRRRRRTRPQGVLLVVADSRGWLHGGLPRPRPLRLLHVLRDRPWCRCIS